MAVFFCKEFIRDLAEHSEANFASKVMAKVCNAAGEFEFARDDHEYKGIDGGFIRYISQRPNYYRAIYIRRGGDIYWYRAGRHEVEERLTPPAEPVQGIAIGKAPEGVDAMEEHRHPKYTKSLRPRYLREVFAARSLIPHRQMILVSPTLAATTIGPLGLTGRLIDRNIELGGCVTVITRPPRDADIGTYRWLESRGVDLLLHKRLNARLYYFEVDVENLDREMTRVRSIAVVGSAELTDKGLNSQLREGEEADEELSYEISEEDLDGAMEFCLDLSGEAVDLNTYLQQRNL
jgi:hypothetical protein